MKDSENKTSNQHTAERLRNYLLHTLKIKQTELASVYGIGITTLNSYFRGVSSLSVNFLKILSTAGINLDYLLTGKGSITTAGLTNDAVRTNLLSKKEWELEFANSDAKSVWLLSDDPKTQKYISDLISKTAETILIPGSGSNVSLPLYLLENHANIEKIYCTDFSNTAVELGKDKLQQISKQYPQYVDKIEFELWDSTKLQYFINTKGIKKIDYIINVNAILAESDLENLSILKSIHSTMDEETVFLSFFPTVFALFEIAHMKANYSKFIEKLDIRESTCIEKQYAMTQKFYAPLKLRQMLDFVGFNNMRTEIYYADSEYMMNETERIYGIQPSDNLPLYEIFTILKKK